MKEDTFNLKNNLDAIDALSDISMELIISEMMDMCEDVKGVIGERLSKLKHLKEVYNKAEGVEYPSVCDSIKLSSLKDVRNQIEKINPKKLNWCYKEYLDFLNDSFIKEMLKVKNS